MNLKEVLVAENLLRQELKAFFPEDVGTSVSRHSISIYIGDKTYDISLYINGEILYTTSTPDEKVFEKLKKHEDLIRKILLVSEIVLTQVDWKQMTGRLKGRQKL
jgi:hypothetical protein